MNAVTDRAIRIKLLIDVMPRDLRYAVSTKYLAEKWFDDVRVDIEPIHMDVTPGAHGHFSRLADPADLHVLTTYSLARMPDALLRGVSAGASLGQTHSEQLGHTGLFNDKLNLDNLGAYRRHVAFHFVWGKYFAEVLHERTGIPADRIYLAGNPRLDAAVRFTGKPIPSDFLFISDFGLADMTDKEFERFRKLYQIKGCDDLHTFFRGVREKFLDWLELAAGASPGKRIIVRPHPGENKTRYEELASRHENVMVVASGDITQLISGADICFGYSSTTVFEAMSLGTPFFALNVESLVEYLDAPVLEYYPWIDKEDFLRVIQRGPGAIGTAGEVRDAEWFISDLTGGSIDRFVLAIVDAARRASAEPHYAPTLTPWEWSRAIWAHLSLALKDAVLKTHSASKHIFGLSWSAFGRRIESHYSRTRDPSLRLDPVELGRELERLIPDLDQIPAPTGRISRGGKYISVDSSHGTGN